MRRVPVAVGVVLASLALGSCSPADQGAVTLDKASGLPTAVVALCDGERVNRVFLRPLRDRRELIWMIEGDGGRGVFEATVAQTPRGFVERVPLDRSRLGGELVLVTETKRGSRFPASESYFRLSELRVGVLDDGGYESDGTSLGSLTNAARWNCEPASMLARSPILRGGGVIVAVALVLAFFERRRAKRLRA